jgi:predicted transcriptional regulator
MSAVRRTVPFAVALKKGVCHAELKNYLGNGNVLTLRWNLNQSATRDHIFAMTIGDKTAYIDLEELLSYTRLM